MQWEKLFCNKRLNENFVREIKKDRSDFERDFDRVVFSSAFRRLQDKTQVIPLPENDFVHTRLTHSLEVSCVGRSIGKIIGQKIIDKYNLQLITASDFGAVVAAACLAHDIGNPPFGHSGEAAISNYFKNGNGKQFEPAINNQAKWADLIAFEGNANGFRLLTNSNSAVAGGIKLTYTTLAAFTKYPCSSHKTSSSNRASQRKYGYFYAEHSMANEIFETLGMHRLANGSWCRHPLAFLVEAADDICYRIIDFEDGVRIGLIDFSVAEALLKALLTEKEFNHTSYQNIPDWREKMGYLRARAITHLINEVCAIFMQNETAILTGDYDQHLVDQVTNIAVLQQIEMLSVEKIYNSKPVLQIEISGFNVVAALLDSFITAVNDMHTYGTQTRKYNLLSTKLIKLLPTQFLSADGKPEGDLYLRILQVCEFIAGMTDTYAMKLFKRLSGFELPYN